MMAQQLRDWLSFQRAWVQFPAPTVSSQLSETPVPGPDTLTQTYKQAKHQCTEKNKFKKQYIWTDGLQPITGRPVDVKLLSDTG